MQFDDSYAQILRLNVAGSPIEWLTWQDATTLYARELVTWTLGDTVRTVWGGTSRLNGERSFIKLHSIIACAASCSRVIYQHHRYSGWENSASHFAARLQRGLLNHTHHRSAGQWNRLLSEQSTWLRQVHQRPAAT